MSEQKTVEIVAIDLLKIVLASRSPTTETALADYQKCVDAVLAAQKKAKDTL